MTSRIKSNLAITAAVAALVVGVSAGSVAAATHVVKHKSSKSAKVFKVIKEKGFSFKSSSRVISANETSTATTETSTATTETSTATTETPVITPYPGDDGDDSAEESELSVEIDLDDQSEDGAQTLPSTPPSTPAITSPSSQSSSDDESD